MTRPFKPLAISNLDSAQQLIKHWWLPTLMTLALIPLVSFDSLLFHTLVELFASGIALVCFIVAWNTFSLSANGYLLVLGCGYLCVGLLDLAHTLTFAGMPFVSPEQASNITISFWMVARGSEAAVLLAAALAVRFPSWRRYLRPRKVLLAAIALLALSSMAVLLNWLPRMFIAGQGLSADKIIGEYFIISLLALALITMHRLRQVDPRVLQLTRISIVLTIAAEIVFTQYASLHSLSLMIGHFLKLLSFWAVYIALIESSLREPFRNLARDANTYDAIPDETLLVDKFGKIRQLNRSARDSLSASFSSLQASHQQQEIIGQHCHELQHDPDVAREHCLVCQHIQRGEALSSYTFFIARQKRWFEISLSRIHHGEFSAGLVHVRHDITEIREAQERFAALNRLYTVLLRANRAVADSNSRQQIFDQICAIAHQHGGFAMVWIGLIDGKQVKPQASAGDKLDYLSEIKVCLDDSALGQGPIGLAIKHNSVHCVNDTLTAPSFLPWRQAAREHGFYAMAAVPLQINGQVIGVCAFYTAESHRFDDKMLELLATLGNDISAALLNLQERNQRQQAEGKLRQLSQAVEQSDNAIIITNTRIAIDYVNRSFIELTGYTQSEVLGRQPEFLYHQQHSPDLVRDITRQIRSGRQWNGEIQLRRKDGSLFWASQSISPIMDEGGDIINYVSSFEDITNLYHAQQTIEKLAFYDPLTNLPNRRLLTDRLSQAIEACRRLNKNPQIKSDAKDEAMVAVMMFDLDNFKTVNDSLGHSKGDELLQQVAQLFAGQVRKEDTVARLGGDEFTIVLSNMKSIDKIADIADTIIQTLKTPLDLGGHQVVIGTSIGISVYPNDCQLLSVANKETNSEQPSEQSPGNASPDQQEQQNSDICEQLLRNADIAMYHAKEEGRNNFQFFTQAMNQRAHQRLLMENKLRHAIREGYFQLYYQPQINLASGELIGLEALIRWIDPQQGVISPLEFIPLAEDTGMIGPIGDWVINTACHELKAMQQAGLPEIKVAVNVSAFQFQNGAHLAATIRDALADSGLNPACLSLEVTESLLINGINETSKLLNELRALNLTIAIDDFGTGYSSLSYLKQLPIDVLKIDQSFIRDILIDPSDKAIVNAIIAMAHKLDIKVLAEGVETPEHQQLLIEQECDFAQGYLYCKPVPKHELLAYWHQLKQQEIISS